MEEQTVNTEMNTQEEAPVEAPQETQETVDLEPVEVPSYTDSLKSLRDDFEKKLEDQRVKYEAELKERDEVIKQIMTEPSVPASEPQSDPILDKINAKRHFIKW